MGSNFLKGRKRDSNTWGKSVAIQSGKTKPVYLCLQDVSWNKAVTLPRWQIYLEISSQQNPPGFIDYLFPRITLSKAVSSHGYHRHSLGNGKLCGVVIRAQGRVLTSLPGNEVSEGWNLWNSLLRSKGRHAQSTLDNLSSGLCRTCPVPDHS